MKTGIEAPQVRILLGIPLLCFSFSLSSAQVFLEADSSGDAYVRLRSLGYDCEVPDCRHPVRHISMVWDADLRKTVFSFTIHRDLDDDRCINSDRQRCEIETDAGSPKTMQGEFSETHTYRWKFRLDAQFHPSVRFCHIHQIKADSGAPDSGSPLISHTLRAGNPDKLQIIYTAPQGVGGSGVLKEVDLALFKGVWVEAAESATFGHRSAYDLVFRRVSDDSLLMSYHNDTLNLWREHAHFNRPKFGIYRSLAAKASLRDESMRLADVSLAEGSGQLAPEMPQLISATALATGRITLSWVDASLNEDQFRIERATDGMTWRYLATVKQNQRTFSDTGLVPGSMYHYRVRSENAWGNSVYLGPVKAQTPKSALRQNQ